MRSQAFGRYQLLQRISMGGMAEVSRAIHTPSGMQVALKRILPEVAEDEEFIKMFEDEARIASQLEHPYIARCLDFGNVDGEWYIAFEFVGGKDMRALFGRCSKGGERIPLWFLVYVLGRVAEGLAYAHARKDANGKPVSIVHRDVSPQNIIVSFDGDVKLIDFGIAKAAGKLSRTQVGSIKGKFGYMSPEQVRGIEVDHRADIFSLGICLWEMVTMQRLFQAENELQVIDKVRKLHVEAPSRFNPECPPELDRIVLKALAKDPDERYRAAKDVYRDLNHVAGTLGLASRDRIAQYMRRAFPEAREGSDGSAAQQVREMGNMASQNDKSGSDLDIFEGLGKKGATARPPAPPPSMRATPPPPPPAARPSDAMKKTLLGVTAPTAMPIPAPSSAGAPPPPSGLQRTPPPPPGRGSLPQVVAPPPKSLPPPAPMRSAPPAPAPNLHAAATAPNPTPAVDMDWDDEDEATHIFDKTDDQPVVQNAAPLPAAGTPPPAASVAKKSTLLGLTAPMQAPPPPSTSQPAPRLTPPPPPPQSTSFARSSGGAVGFPPPPTINPVPPPPVTQQGMGMTMPMPMTPPPPQHMSAAPNPLMAVPAPMPPPRPLSVPEYQPPPRVMEATALVRPPQSRAGLWVVLGLVGVAVIGVAVFLLMPHTGRIAINVSDGKNGGVNRLDIFVDGRKTPCETAPCIVDQVSAGTHEVKVLADGYDSVASQSVNVESGKDATASFTLAATSRAAGLRVSGSQAGVKLFVDDKEIGPLPQEVKDLPPGDHAIKIAGSERYQALDKHVTVEKDKVEDLGTVTLKVLKGKATISLGTAGARVFLVSGTDRRELPMLPISVDIDTAKTWSLQATKVGYADYNQAISFDDGQAEKSFVVSLDLKGAASTSNAATQTAVAATPAPAPAPRPTPTPTPAPQPAATGGGSSDEGSSEAYLNINSIPPSTCFLDGRSLGSTPKAHITVKPGTHTVKFVNSDQGLSKTISVTVGAGETKPAVAKLN
jgi:serine/threonine protein kinase